MQKKQTNMTQFLKDTLPPFVLIFVAYFLITRFMLWATNYLNEPKEVVIVVRNQEVMQQTPVRFEQLPTQED